MGGGLAGHELAAAVSDAGGLGTIGLLPAEQLAAEIAAARALTDRPLAVNLLLPFARSAHFQVASRADALVTFWGRPKRRTANVWIHQCGSLAEALKARAAGADGVIAQGVEAGGHVRGTTPAVELLASLRGALGPDYPVLSAGGVAGREDVAARLRLGADAVVCGTGFLMTEESRAHPEYKALLTRARDTVLTELFGAGWPAPHRVVANEATARWLGADPRGPRWLRGFYRASAPLLGRLPIAAQQRMAHLQSPRRPPFGPAPATEDGPPGLVQAGPLYAGECVAWLSDVVSAAERLAALTP
jgi:NAD(P)H-dependent flavin oxidoreductase YrpB (nitropropane dioxygenase family)